MESCARKNILIQKQRKTAPQDGYESTFGTTKKSAEKFAAILGIFRREKHVLIPLYKALASLHPE